MQIRRNVVTEQTEERGNGERLVAIAYDLEVDRMSIEEIRNKGDERIRRDHE